MESVQIYIYLYFTQQKRPKLIVSARALFIQAFGLRPFQHRLPCRHICRVRVHTLYILHISTYAMRYLSSVCLFAVDGFVVSARRRLDDDSVVM